MFSSICKKVMKAKGISNFEIAEKVFHSAPQTSSKRFTLDDFRESDMAELAKYFGMDLEIRLIPKDPDDPMWKDMEKSLVMSTAYADPPKFKVRTR